MLTEFIIDTRTDEIISRLSMDVSHTFDKYSQISLFCLSSESRIQNAVTTITAAIVILSNLMCSSNLIITKINYNRQILCNHKSFFFF